MKSLLRSTMLLGVLGFAGLAWADGGYFAGVLGTRAAGRGGAFVARADDVTAVAYNPAGLAKLQSTIIQVGNQFSHNAYSFTRASTMQDTSDGSTRITFPQVHNQSPWQAADPFLGVASNLGLENWGFALVAYAPSGIANEQFPLAKQDQSEKSGQRYMMVSRENLMLNYSASLAWKYQELFGVGASLQWIHVPRMTYQLVIDGTPTSDYGNPVASDYDILSTVKGSSLFTFNAVLGAWVRPVPSLEIGLSAQVMPANAKINGHLTLTQQGESIGRIRLTDIVNDDLADNVTVTLPLPQLFRGGARYRYLEGGRELFDLELDVDYTTWSRVKQLGLDASGLRATAQSEVLDLHVINIEKQWQDSIGIRLGGDYAILPDRLTIRAGVYYESAVSKTNYFNVDFPTGYQIGGAVGASMFFGPWEVAFAYSLRVQPTASVSESYARVYQQAPKINDQCPAPYTNQKYCFSNYLGQPGPAINAGTYSASSHFASLSATYRF